MIFPSCIWSYSKELIFESSVLCCCLKYFVYFVAKSSKTDCVRAPPGISNHHPEIPNFVFGSRLGRVRKRSDCIAVFSVEKAKCKDRPLLSQFFVVKLFVINENILWKMTRQLVNIWMVDFVENESHPFKWCSQSFSSTLNEQYVRRS